MSAGKTGQGSGLLALPIQAAPPGIGPTGAFQTASDSDPRLVSFLPDNPALPSAEAGFFFNSSVLQSGLTSLCLTAAPDLQLRNLARLRYSRHAEARSHFCGRGFCLFLRRKIAR
jgi:hypothetical protein